MMIYREPVSLLCGLINPCFAIPESTEKVDAGGEEPTTNSSIPVHDVNTHHAKIEPFWVNEEW
jgi:hypothetical protein